MASSASSSSSPRPGASLSTNFPFTGLTGEDLEWGKKCLDGEGSYCTKFGNVAELQTKDFAKAEAA